MMFERELRDNLRVLKHFQNQHCSKVLMGEAARSAMGTLARLLWPPWFQDNIATVVGVLV